MFDLPLPARLATVAAFGYAVGCLNAGYYLVRWRTRGDLRDLHSGNAGATNAGRVLGRAGFAAVLLLDAAKGALAAAIGSWLAGTWGGTVGALASIVGHIWPAQLSFRGGKGIATALGAFLVVEPFTVLACSGIALTLFAITRRWSASGLAGVALAPLVGGLSRRDTTVFVALALAVAIVLVAHRDDLAALRRVRGAPGPGPRDAGGGGAG
ncbi:MAG: glycerol-3-phosphate acyltransferase [Gemmatimonadetes bacterium]|nr:glycerol-3-phosphate acyltransferase [Gemmatimonadota bacterium]